MRRLIAPAVLVAYAMIPAVAFILVRGSDSPEAVGIDVVLSVIPLLLLATIGWRLVWPRWKLFGKLVVHPCI